MFKTNKDFTRAFLKIAIPMSLQQLMMSSLSLVDTIMVGQLGDVAIASVGVGNQVTFLVHLFLLGVSGGCSLFASQFYGKGDLKSIRSVIGIGLVVGVSLISLYSIANIFFAESAIGIFTQDSAVISAGASYLRIVAFTYVIATVTTVYSTVVRSTGNAFLPMVVSFLGIGLNTVLNFILIFGKLGFAPLGIRGAAYATLISRVVEMVLLLAVIYTKKMLAAAKFRELFTISKGLVDSFLRQSGLMITKDLVWGVGTTLYLAVYGRIGTAALAATNIQQTIGSMMYVFLYGIAQACLILVGQQLGRGDSEKAYDYAIYFTKITVIVASAVSAIMLLMRPIILLPFNISDEVLVLTNSLLLVRGLTYVIGAYNNISVVGVMRSGGDTKFSLVLDFFAVWVIGLTLAFVTGIVLHLSAVWVLIAISTQEVFKMFPLRRRVASRKWMNNVVSELTTLRE